MRFKLTSLGVALAVTLTASTAVLVPRPAHAVAMVCVNCSTNIQQLLQYAQELETAINSANQLSTQINQYNQMVQQGLKLPGQVWGNVQSDLSSLNNITSQGSNIAYSTSNLASKFQQSFPTYQQYLSGNTTPAQVQQQLQSWTQQNYDAASTSLQAAQQQSQQMTTTEASQLSSAQSHSSSAAGQMQAIQAGNEMASMQVQQLQKLRELVMLQANMQAQALAAQSRQQAADAAVAQKYVVDPATVTPPANDTYQAAPNIN